MNVIHKTGSLAAVVGCALIAFTLSAGAQDNGLRASIIAVNDDEYPNARAIVSIENTSASESPALDASAFTATIDGETASVVGAELASSEDAPLDVLMLMDTSGTTEGDPLAAAKSAAKAFLQELAPTDRVAVMAFSDEVRLLQEYTADRALVVTAIDALSSGGNTALYQATTVAAITAAQSPASRKAIILLSDAAGEYGNKSIATREEAISAATSAAVPFFNIAQGSGEDRAYFIQIAEATRGRFLEAPRSEDLNALYVSIGRLLRSQYVVTFDASKASADGGSQVAITVTLRTGAPDGELQATAESAYRPGPGFLPTITIEGLSAGDNIDVAREVTVAVSNGSPRVTWYLDGVNVLELSAPPYVFTFDPARFDGGEHTLRVATGEGASPAESSVAFSSTAPVSSAGGPPIVPIAAVVGVLAFVGGAVFVVRRRAPKGDAPIPAEQRTTSWAAQVASKRAAADGPPQESPESEMAAEDIGRALGLLVSRGGSDLGSEYEVGGKPVSIGAGVRCGVRIRDGELASEEARIWVRGQHLMLHMFTRLTTVESGGSGGGWQILEAGDTFQIGQHTFEFKLITEAQPAEAPDSATPNVLRDPEAERRPPQPGPFSDLMPRAD